MLILTKSLTFRFVRTFTSTPVVPNIKVEPSNYLDVDLGVNNDENRNTNHEGNRTMINFVIHYLKSIVKFHVY